MIKKCGVNKNLYKQYDFNEHIWYLNKNTRADLLYLAQRAVKIGSTYWLKQVNGEHWHPLVGIIDAEKEAINTWLGGILPSGTIVDESLIHTFFSGEEFVPGPTPKAKWISIKVGSCPNVSQKMVVPMGPSFVTYNNQSYLNTWYDDMIVGEKKHLRFGKLVLIMCYGALCNGKIDIDNIEIETDRIYKMIVDNNYDNIEFRFLMNWLAAMVQYSGINLQTNLWLIGTLEGLGKGTLVDVMRLILGSEFVGELNQTELENGWNDHLVGKQLIEVNEFDAKGKWSGSAWSKWLKGHTIEPTFKVRERNKTAYTVLHIGNFLGTSNNIEQTFIDANDRRNQFIQTSSNPFWVNFATGIQLKYFKKQPKDVAAGFSYILEQVKVDLDFIAKSNKNQFRNSIASNNQNIIEEWIDQDPTINKGVLIDAREAYESYKQWYRNSHPSDAIPSETAFGKIMSKSEHLGIVKHYGKINQYIFGIVPIIIEQKLEDAVKSINDITHDKDQIVVFDYDIEEPKQNFSDMTALEKMRALLQKKNAQDVEKH